MKYELKAVPNVSEVASVGGMVRQYQIVLDPDRLRSFNITHMSVAAAVQRANQETGGSVLELGEAEYMVRASGYLANLDDFRKIPFYYKVREYNDFESRDLWEYDLALRPDQLRMLVAHLWELGSTYFAYYYLSENCSYHILGVIEAADPNLNLISELSWPVLPADTVKALFRNPGLVRAVNYRPSNRTQFRQRVETLDPEELEMVSALMADPRRSFPKALSVQRRVKVLDTAIDLIDVRGGPGREPSPAFRSAGVANAAHRSRFAATRSRFGVRTEFGSVSHPRFPAGPARLGGSQRRLSGRGRNRVSAG